MPSYAARKRISIHAVLLVVAATAAAALAGAGRAPAGPAGLVAAYSFDAGGGTSLADISGSGNTGTISGARWTKAGRHGGALTFDGIDDWVTVPGSAGLQLTGALTLEAWVRPTALASTWRTALVKERPGSLDYALYAHDGGPGPSGHVNVGGDRYAPTGAVPLNAWTHLATTYDGAALRLYVNGALRTTLAVRGAVATSTSPLRIGGNSVWGEWFAGRIDDVRIYNRALSPAEVQADMTTPVRPTSTQPSPSQDTQAPSVPQGLRVTGTTQTSVALAWNASTDDVGVTGYRHYRNGVPVGTTEELSYTHAGLQCGTTYALSVEAYDAAGNASHRPEAVANVSTAPCSPDTQSPAAPSGLAQTASTASEITISWAPASDNVGVTGYGHYVGGTLVGSGAGTSHTFTGLACNTTYTVGVDAYDAAGNRSGRASATGSTAACAAAPPPPSPSPSDAAHVWVDTSGGSCTRQGTAGAYADTQACGSFAAAYAAAASGDTIRVRPGTYPAQFFAGGVGSSQGGGTKTLTFVGEAGNVVRQIHFGSAGLTFDGIRIDSGGVKTSGAAFENSGSSFVFKNGSIGNVVDEKGAMISGPNMIFDNVLFHDVVLRTSGVHLECIMALWNQGMVIRNSTFRNCGIMDASIGIGDWWQPPPPPYTHVTLENNFFGNSRTDGGRCCAAYSLALWATKMPSGSDYGVLDNWRIVRNHFEPGSGVIVRPHDNGTSLICGNTGSVPTSTWARTCP